MNQQEQREFAIRLAFHCGRTLGQFVAGGLLQKANNPYLEDPEKCEAWNTGFTQGLEA
jgi:hypothetical protein